MKQRIIFVMNRWDSSKGGIQTVNRELILALARTRPDLDCTAVVTFAENSEADQAFRSGVTLIHGQVVDDWMSVLMSEQFKQFSSTSVIAVVGHSSFSGAPAKKLRDFWFPSACAVQFIHMDPMRTEAIKEHKRDSFVAEREAKQKAELDIAKLADVVFCVGPRLFRVTRDMFLAHQLDYGRVHRIDCGLATDQQVREAAPEQPTVVCLGRTESASVKGLDIFAYTAGLIDQQWSTNPLTKKRHIKPRYIVRGAEKQPEALQAQLMAWAAEVGGAPEIVVRPYTTEKESLNADLRGATAFLMPSREEGFGLVACEAMSLGAPIIVSQQSGIAELILETARQTGQNFSSCVVDMSGDAKEIASRFADATLPLLVEGEADELLYPRLRGYLSSVCSWDVAASTFWDVVEGAYQARLARAPVTPAHTDAPTMAGSVAPSVMPLTIENVLAAERDSLMTKPGVIAVGLKQAIVVTVEKGAKPNLPKKIDGFEVIVREVEEVKLTSVEPSGGYKLLVNGVRRATVGLFGVNSSGQLFAVTVAHAVLNSSHDIIEMVVDNHRVPLFLEILEERTDLAILRVEGGELSFTHRSLGYRRPGAKVFVELPDKIVQGSIDAVDMTMDFSVGDRGKRRYEDLFEVALDTGIVAGSSGAVVMDEQGEMLGVVIGAMVKEGGSMSVLACDASAVLERHMLTAAAIDEMAAQPRIGLLLDNGDVANALFNRLPRINRFTRSGRLYFRGTTLSGARVTCTILREHGNVESAVAMTSMIIDNKLDAVFVISRCAGLQSNQQIGDVVISSEVLIFEPTFFSSEVHHVRPRVSVTASVLHHLGRELADQYRLGRIHVGPLASASGIVRGEQLGTLKAASRSLVALDVGAASAVQAASAISSELPVVVVSVIVDLSNNSKLHNPDIAYRGVEVVLEMASQLKVLSRAKRRRLTIERPLHFNT